MDRANDVVIFGLGCFGAIAPEIVRLYRLRLRPPRKGFSAYYWVVSCTYAITGGIVAICLPAVTLHAALYAGISAPVLISAAVRNKKTPLVASNSADSQVSEVQRRPFSELFRTHANGIFSQSDQDAA